MKKIVIGVTGKAGTGKDTIGDYLVDNYGFKKFAMADPLKVGVKELFLIDDETMYNRVKREEPLEEFPDWTVRKLLQFVGTDLLRNKVDENIWVKIMMRKIRLSKCDRIVISDIRFPNELTCIKENPNLDSSFFRVVREFSDVGNLVGLGNHESESYDLDYDFYCDNNGDYQDLYNRIDEIMNLLKFEKVKPAGE